MALFCGSKTRSYSPCLSATVRRPPAGHRKEARFYYNFWPRAVNEMARRSQIVLGCPSPRRLGPLSRTPRMLVESFDALIVGGGPAGATAALLLAEAGWSVALVE